MFEPVRPRRSFLYMPGSNERALEKGKSLSADGLILDLEDAVAPDAKADAREKIYNALKHKAAFGKREILIRTNGLDTPWGYDDAAQMGIAGSDGILVPKVESADMIKRVSAILDENGAPSDLPIWCMMETPRGILNALSIADEERVKGFVLGTSDLVKDLQAQHTKDRLPVIGSLNMCVLAARAAKIPVLDGVYLDLSDEEGFQAACQQGRELGFDGKTLIHPKQLDAANTCFAPDEEVIAWSRKIIAEFDKASEEGKAVVVVDGKLIENLHVAEARRLVMLADLIGAS